MKYVQLAVIGGLLLGGCVNPHTQPGATSASALSSEERELPTGSLIAKKSNRRDAPDKVDMQRLENDRIMNNNGLSIQQRQ